MGMRQRAAQAASDGIFLIARRPQYGIREVLAQRRPQPLLPSFTRPLELNNLYNPDADIKLYYDSTFRQIHHKYLRLGTHLPSAWPSNSDVDRLLSKGLWPVHFRC